jgi:hypothetical protein
MPHFCVKPLKPLFEDLKKDSFKLKNKKNFSGSMLNDE